VVRFAACLRSDWVGIRPDGYGHQGHGKDNKFFHFKWVVDTLQLRCKTLGIRPIY